MNSVGISRIIHKNTLFKSLVKVFSTQPVQRIIELNNNKYESDDYSNLSPKIVSYLGRNIHLQKNHPLSLVRQKIINFFYEEYANPRGSPSFSVYDGQVYLRHL